MKDKELKKGDVIDIIKYDGDGREALRRVRVIELSKGAAFYAIQGTNMKGDNPHSYRLPLLPSEFPIKSPKSPSIHWLHF